MNRRQFLSSAAAAPAAGLVNGAAPPPRNTLETEIKRLKLKHTWTTTMSSSEFRDTVHIRLTRDGITGHGEGAPIPRYKETAAETQKSIEYLRGVLTNEDPFHFTKIRAIYNQVVRGSWAAKAAIDMALMDWVGQKLGIPLYHYFGLDPKMIPLTSFSIGIDKPEMIKQKLAEAAAYPVYKIKVGLDGDEAIIEAARKATDKPIRVDANEGWKDRETALRKVKWMQSKGVQLVEQPMPADMIEDAKWLRSRAAIPIIADEACQSITDIPKLVGAYDGVNIKIDKAGGMMEAYRMMLLAKSFGLTVMIGCMVSSSCSITAAAHLAALANYVDLDGHLLISNDPYKGVVVDRGKVILSDKPGLGLTPA